MIIFKLKKRRRRTGTAAHSAAIQSDVNLVKRLIIYFDPIKIILCFGIGHCKLKSSYLSMQGTNAFLQCYAIPVQAVDFTCFIYRILLVTLFD